MDNLIIYIRKITRQLAKLQLFSTLLSLITQQKAVFYLSRLDRAVVEQSCHSILVCNYILLLFIL